MKNISIVTGFFNINRANWKGFGRTEELYLQYFKGWGKIENDLIVYVEDRELKEKIEEYRKDVPCKTMVILVDNIKNIDIELYKSIDRVTNDLIHRRFRTKPNNPEVWNTDYDYIMLMKMWCVQDAVSKGYASGMVAWVDFGYLHGEADLIKIAGGKFTWNYDFEHKINVFSVQNLDEKPIFDIVKNMDTYIMGTVLVAPSELWSFFWKEMRENMLILNACGLVDDDQTIILMCYRGNPDMFCVHQSEWNMPVIQYSNIGIKTFKQEANSKISFIRKFARLAKKTFDNLRYSMNVFIDLQNLDRK